MTSNPFSKMCELLLDILNNNNWSYWTIVLNLLVALLPRLWVALGPGNYYYYSTGPNGGDIRGILDDLDETDMRQILPIPRRKIERAQNVVRDNFEGLPLLAAAVVALNAAGVPILERNLVPLAYTAARLVYAYAYINQNHYPHFRTFAWCAGMGTLLYMFVSAGQHIATNPAAASYPAISFISADTENPFPFANFNEVVKAAKSKSYYISQHYVTEVDL
ncbi:putative Glutathione transferase [Seiridium unicorne]|uniref:Glutathione transferase n=1 Tax=Seiridium unicorne TaxID=138068 RepID=A0ABR2V8J9_9PEZI